MILNINPTRMELLNLKKKLNFARRGHKLLKDKFDELVKKFMGLVDTLKETRVENKDLLRKSFNSFVRTKANTPPYELNSILSLRRNKVNFNRETGYIVGTKVDNFRVDKEYENDLIEYNFLSTGKEINVTLNNYGKLLSSMIKLAEIELKIRRIGEEIESTRRRVNALEYTLIPNLIDTIKYINTKIDEMERGNLVRIMKIKEIVRKH